MFERVQHGRSDLYYADEAGVEEITSAGILNLGDRVYCVSNDTMLYAGIGGLYNEAGTPTVPYSGYIHTVNLDEVTGGNSGGLLRAAEGTPITPPMPSPSVIPDEIKNSSFKLIEAGGNGRLWYAMSFGLEVLSEYLEFADRVYVIDQGKVVMWIGEDYVEDLATGSSTTTDTATTTVFDNGQPLIPSN